MINETATFFRAALETAGFKAGKITTTSDSSFNADNDVRPVSAVFGIKFTNFRNIDHAGNVKHTDLEVLIIIADRTQEDAVLKILDIDDAVNGKYIEFEDERFTMEGEFRLGGDPEPLTINKKEASYAIIYNGQVTIRR